MNFDITHQNRLSILHRLVLTLGCIIGAYYLFFFTYQNQVTFFISLTVLGFSYFFVSIIFYTNTIKLIPKWFLSPDHTQKRIISCIVFIFTLLYLYFANKWIDRQMSPIWHDDQMHALQVRMLADGRLWMPEHPLSKFFETFHVFVRPVYASIHFPGTSLLNVAGVWMGLPLFVFPLLFASICNTLIYKILTDIFNGTCGLVGAIIFCSCGYLRFLSVHITSHVPILMLGLILIWLWLKWRQKPSGILSAIMGAVGGLALVTRPLEATAYLIPVLLLMILDYRKYKGIRKITFPLAGILAASPFILLQLYFDYHVAGSLFYSPYQKYNDLNYPNINYAASSKIESQQHVHASDILQKQEYYDFWLRGFIGLNSKTPTFTQLYLYRLPRLLRYSLPDPVLYPLFFIGFASLMGKERWLLASIVVIFISLYTLHLFFLPHYPLIVLPSIIALVWMGKDQLVQLAGKKYRQRCNIFLIILMVASALTSMTPFCSIEGEDAPISFVDTRIANEQLRNRITKPAVVLFKYHSGNNFHDEPVYNFEKSWPDDQQIIRAHDLGDQNIELYNYYAKYQPYREIWLYDRATKKLSFIGQVSTLAISRNLIPSINK